MKNLEYIVNKFIKDSEGQFENKKLPSTNDLKDIEKKLNFKLHEDYKYFLTNAGNYYKNDIQILLPVEDQQYGHDIYKNNYFAWKAGVPRDQLVIAMDNGEYFCLDKNGKVHYWCHDGVTDESWDSIAQWIEAVLLADYDD